MEYLPLHQASGLQIANINRLASTFNPLAKSHNMLARLRESNPFRLCSSWPCSAPVIEVSKVLSSTCKKLGQRSGSFSLLDRC